MRVGSTGQLSYYVVSSTQQTSDVLPVRHMKPHDSYHGNTFERERHGMYLMLIWKEVSFSGTWGLGQQ